MSLLSLTVLILNCLTGSNVNPKTSPKTGLVIFIPVQKCVLRPGLKLKIDLMMVLSVVLILLVLTIMVCLQTV